MFSGIIQAMGEISSRETSRDNCRFTIEAEPEFVQTLSEGASVSVNGVCLTCVAFDKTRFAMDVSGETLKYTTLGKLKLETPVNLERALRIGDELGGHWVSGHVDGTGLVISRAPAGNSEQFIIDAPDAIAPLIAPKGSISIDGVSLTVNAVIDARFEVNVIPHTLEKTNFCFMKEGDRVNLEADLIARYLARLIQSAQG